jgi:hypothetical protein
VGNERYLPLYPLKTIRQKLLMEVDRNMKWYYVVANLALSQEMAVPDIEIVLIFLNKMKRKIASYHLG